MKLSKRAQWILIIVLVLLVMIATIPAAIWLTHTPSARLGNERARAFKKATGL